MAGVLGCCFYCSGRVVFSRICNCFDLFGLYGLYRMNIEELTIAFKQHESQCDERWKTIFNKVNRIERTLLGATGAVLLLLLTLVLR